MKNLFSIIILTYNEEETLETCLESIIWCDDVVIVDSFSIDKTCEILESVLEKASKSSRGWGACADYYGAADSNNI